MGFLLGFGALASCGEGSVPADAADLAPLDTSGCPAAPVDPTGRVAHEVVATGILPNAIVVDDAGMAWVVNSGDNTVSRYDTAAPAVTLVPDFVDLGLDRNPYDLALDADRVYVTNLLAGSLAVADRATGALLDEVRHEALVAPQDVLVAGELVLVAAAGFTGAAPPGERVGQLVALDRASLEVVAVVETAWSNPQFLHLEGDALYVVSSGTTRFDPATGLVTPASAAGVERFSVASLAALGSAATASAAWELGADGLVGNAGPPARVGDSLFMGSGTAAVLFELDTRLDRVVHGAANPIRLRAEDAATNSLVVAYAGPEAGLLTLLDFNRDALWLYDPACGRAVSHPIDLGKRGEMLEGPRDLAFAPDGSAHIVMSLASTVTTWRAD